MPPHLLYVPQKSWPVSCRAEKTSVWCSTRDYSAGPNVTLWPTSCYSKSELTPVFMWTCEELLEHIEHIIYKPVCFLFLVLMIGSSILPTLTLSSTWLISCGVRRQKANSEYEGLHFKWILAWVCWSLADRWRFRYKPFFNRITKYFC